MSTYRVSVLSGERALEERDLNLRHPEACQVLVKVDSCAICTLEQRVYLGAMKRYPFAGGHEAAGVVAEIGSEVTSVKPGDKVAIRLLTHCGQCHYCRTGRENQCEVSFKATVHEGLNGPGGFSEYMIVDAKTVFKLDDSVNLSHAALSEPLACCVHSVGNGRIELGEDAVVIGVGIMGALHIQLAKLRGARVIACEVNPARLEIAKKMGADVLINSREQGPVEAVKGLTGGRGADAVFCTAALPPLAAQAIQMTGKLGRTVMYSSFHPKEPISLDVNHVHYSEMIITGAINPTVKDFYTATRLMSLGLVDLSAVISETVPLSKLNYAFERAIDPATYRIIVKA